MGQPELATQFDGAIEHERGHLRRGRAWIRAALVHATGGRLPQAFGQEEPMKASAAPATGPAPRRRKS